MSGTAAEIRTTGLGKERLGGESVSPERLDTLIDAAARELAANDMNRDAEILALRTALMLVVASLDRLDPKTSQDISQVLMGRAASWRKRGGDNPGAAAIERLADDLARRLPPMPPPEPEPHSDPT
jgi:hypothetical protein